MPSPFFARDHLRVIGITCGPRSFAVKFEDRLRSWHHLRTRAFIQPNACSIISFLFQFSQLIIGKFLLLEINEFFRVLNN